MLKVLRTIANITHATILQDGVLDNAKVIEYTPQKYADGKVTVPKNIALPTAPIKDPEGKFETVDNTDGEVTIDIKQTRGLRVPITTEEFSISRPDFLQEMAKKGARSILNALIEDVNRELATAQKLFIADGAYSFDNIVDAESELRESGSMVDDLLLSAGVSMKRDLSKDSAIRDSRALGSDVIKKGYLGEVNGISIYDNYKQGKHVGGDFGKNVDVTIGAETDGTNTVTLTAGPVSSGGTIKKGDVLKIAGKTYMVTADSEAFTGDITVTVDKNVPEGIPVDTPVTLKQEYSISVIHPKDAVVIVGVERKTMVAGNAVTVTHKGLSIRVAYVNDEEGGGQAVIISATYGAKNIVPEHSMLLI